MRGEGNGAQEDGRVGTKGSTVTRTSIRWKFRVCVGVVGDAVEGTGRGQLSGTSINKWAFVGKGEP